MKWTQRAPLRWNSWPLELSSLPSPVQEVALRRGLSEGQSLRLSLDSTFSQWCWSCHYTPFFLYCGFLSFLWFWFILINKQICSIVILLNPHSISPNSPPSTIYSLFLYSFKNEILEITSSPPPTYHQPWALAKATISWKNLIVSVCPFSLDSWNSS